MPWTLSVLEGLERFEETLAAVYAVRSADAFIGAPQHDPMVIRLGPRSDVGTLCVEAITLTHLTDRRHSDVGDELHPLSVSESEDVVTTQRIDTVEARDEWLAGGLIRPKCSWPC